VYNVIRLLDGIGVGGLMGLREMYRCALAQGTGRWLGNRKRVREQERSQGTGRASGSMERIGTVYIPGVLCLDR
jgi:hypothetical protein